MNPQKGAATHGKTGIDDSFLARQRLLVIAPHADDEVAGAGGLMWRVKEAGGEVFVMVLSIGNLDHYDNKDGMVASRTRRDELADAMNLLKVDDFDVVLDDDHLHLRLDTLPRRDLVHHIERGSRLATDKVQPTMVVLPAPSYNQDHEALYFAGITACRPHLATMKAFQRFVLVADAPQLAWGSQPFHPNFYVDISGCLDRKLEAFRCHRSQQRPSPHQGGADAIEFLARARGREISVEAAEAFSCMRFVV
ncbi:MAG: PIG-L family deacetylase [Planctomycetes bacterium]|nr:PIG-L family deacetylase [Planctomycetota bacterium]